MPIATNPNTGEVVFLDPNGQWTPAKTAVNPETRQMMAFDGKDWQAVTSHGKGILGYVDDAVRALASGATFGYADEIAAKANSLFNGKDYETNLASERARDANIPGVISVPAEIAGGVGSAIASAPVTGPLAVASGAAKLPGLARSVLGGMGIGALYGSGNADSGIENRAEGAVKGGVIGGAVGAAAPYVATGISRGIEALRGPRASVSGQLGRALERDQITPQDALTSANALAADRPGVATLADVGGENVKGLVERVAQTPGAGRTTVVPFLTGRQQQQASRISDDLASLTGTNKSAMNAINDTIAERAAAAKPLYDDAMNFNARENLDVAKAWSLATDTGWGKRILASRDFKNNIQTEYGIKDPNVAPLMVQIDSWKKVADDLIQSAIQSGNKNNARVISQMRDSVIDAVDAANPAYAKARAAWAGPTQYISAIQHGKDSLSPKIGADEMSSMFSQLNPSEQEAFRIGLISAIKGKMASDPARIADMTKYLRSPQMRDKISSIMPSPEAAASWNNRLGFEVNSSALTGRALGNSATARRLAEHDDANGVVGDLILEFASGGGGSLLKRIMMSAPTKVRDTLRSRSDKLLAEVLTDPQSLQNLQDILNRASGANRGPSPVTIGAATTGANAELNAPR